MLENPSLKINQKKTHEHYLHAVSAASLKIINYWRASGVEIQKELLFPNDKPNNQPYSVDAFLVKEHILVEIDGAPFHLDTERDQKRDKHIEGIASHTGHDCHIIRLPLVIPEHLIFGNLQGKKRQEVKVEYQKWLANWAKVELASLPDRLKLARLSKTKNLPTYF